MVLPVLESVLASVLALVSVLGQVKASVRVQALAWAWVLPLVPVFLPARRSCQ